MQSITLKEFCDMKNYGPGKGYKFTLSMLANEIGVSIALVSKVYNSMYIISSKGSNGEAYKKIERYVERFGYKLIPGDAISCGNNSLARENSRLSKEIAIIQAENEKLKAELKELREFRRICKTIALYEEELVGVDRIKLNVVRRVKEE